MKPSQGHNCPWIELAARTSPGMVRNHFVKADDIKAIMQWRHARCNRNVYASICRFQEPRRSSPYLCDFGLDVNLSPRHRPRMQAESQVLPRDEGMG